MYTVSLTEDSAGPRAKNLMLGLPCIMTMPQFYDWCFWAQHAALFDGNAEEIQRCPEDTKVQENQVCLSYLLKCFFSQDALPLAFQSQAETNHFEQGGCHCGFTCPLRVRDLYHQWIERMQGNKARSRIADSDWLTTIFLRLVKAILETWQLANFVVVCSCFNWVWNSLFPP